MSISPDQLRKRQSLLRRAIGGLLIFFIAICYATCYRPTAARLRDLHAQNSVKQLELHALQAHTKSLPALQSEVDRLASRLQPFSHTLPKQADLPAFIKEIGSVSQTSSIRKFDCQPGAVRKVDELSEQKIMLTFEGDFANVFRFVQQAEAMQRLTRVRKLSIKTKDPKLGQVEVRMAMNIYYAE